MDQSLSSSSSLISSSVLTLILVLSITLVVLYKKAKSNKKLPPGPWRLPIIGNIHQLVSSNLHHQLADMAKKYGPLMYLQLGQLPHLVVSSPEAAMEVMKYHDLEFAGRPSSFGATIITYNYKDIAFGDYGDYWRWLRKICVVDLLSAKRVQSFRYIRDEEASSMVESIRLASSQGSTSVDLKQQLLALTGNIVARASFGKLSKEKIDVYTPMVKRLVDAYGGFSIANFFPSIGFLPALTGSKSLILKLHRDVDGVFQSIIDEHRARKVRESDEPHNLLDFLLNLQEHGGDQLEFPLTTDHIKAIILDMFSAGIETSSTTLEWLMSELMANPMAMKKVQNEVRQTFQDKDKVEETRFHTLSYFDAVIKEALRLHPPFPFLLPRKVRENNVTINGYEVPIGSTVLVNAWAIGRHPDHWIEPEKFYPERFLDNDVDYKGTYFQFIPFGAGRRMCIGVQFGMTGVEVALANLLYHFDWEFPNGVEAESLDMSEDFGLTTGRKVDLHLKPIPWSCHSKTEEERRRSS